jgi:hypothetical protein
MEQTVHLSALRPAQPNYVIHTYTHTHTHTDRQTHFVGPSSVRDGVNTKLVKKIIFLMMHNLTVLGNIYIYDKVLQYKIRLQR